MGKLCDNCLQEISENLSQDDLRVLNYLKKSQTFNQHASVDKTSVMPNVKGMTEFKFNAAMGRLEAACLVKRTTMARPNRFWITKSGRRILEIVGAAMQQGPNGKED